MADKALIAQALEEKVWPLVAGRSVKPLIDATFPLRRPPPAAHAHMEGSTHIGKIVLTIG